MKVGRGTLRVAFVAAVFALAACNNNAQQSQGQQSAATSAPTPTPPPTTMPVAATPPAAPQRAPEPTECDPNHPHCPAGMFCNKPAGGRWYCGTMGR